MRNIKRLLGAVIFFAVSVMASAQNDSILFEDNTRIDTTARGELRLNIDGMGFFRDNEYKGSLRKGYTLPGFGCSPRSAISLSRVCVLRRERICCITGAPTNILA